MDDVVWGLNQGVKVVSGVNTLIEALMMIGL